jgi:hypothetical protein
MHPADMTGDDAASLTALLRDYGGPLCEISRTPQGYRAARRPPPTPPLAFTAATVPALRELLEHGYDPAKLAAVISDFGGEWQVEHIDPGSAWIALSHGEDGLIRVIAANDLDSLRGSLGRTVDAAEQRRRAGHAARAMPLGDPDDWIRIAARAGATAEEIAEAGRVPASHVRTVLDADGARL